MIRRGFLLLRRAGGMWGIANADVASLTRRGESYGVGTAESTLRADEIVGVVDDLAVRPLAAAVRRFWPEASLGWAVHGALPVVLVDPQRPPRALAWAEGEPTDGE